MKNWSPEEIAISEQLNNTQEITNAETSLKQLTSNNLYIVEYDSESDFYYLRVFRIN